SKTRVRVEHVFGFVENSMNGSTVRTIGLPRVKAKIGGGKMWFSEKTVLHLCQTMVPEKQVFRGALYICII
ncbi:MAG: hypothetical protein U9N86_14000, partial [Bacteroidota bacterium]|nr:hypothetical protein [Bacteroidota bacterium]